MAWWVTRARHGGVLVKESPMSGQASGGTGVER
jgi:hypothetical protein